MAARLSLSLLLTLASFAAVWGADASKTVIVGGYDDAAGVTSRKADLISDGTITHLPNLPEGIYANRVVVHDDKLYSCGGIGTDGGIRKKCVILDLALTEEEYSSWSSTLELPDAVSHQPMMAVGDDLWILGDNVTVVPFNGGPISEHDIPEDLFVGFGTCGGSHESVRFIVPDGEYGIWINTNQQNPGEWIKTASVGNNATFKSCMIKDKHIYVSGGELYVEDYSEYLTVVERINVEDGTIQTLPDLLHGRSYHGMGILDGQVAVFGGYNGSGMGSVEVYNENEEKWTLYPRSLGAGKVSEMGYTTY